MGLFKHCKRVKSEKCELVSNAPAIAQGSKKQSRSVSVEALQDDIAKLESYFGSLHVACHHEKPRFESVS